MNERSAAIKALEEQIIRLTQIRADYDALAAQSTDNHVAAHLREQAALYTGFIAQARADRAAINY